LATVEVLKTVNNKLYDQAEEKKKTKKGLTFWKKNHETTTTSTLMEAKELSNAIENATAIVSMDENADEDHLYVPGKVVLLYDEWSKTVEKQKLKDDTAAAAAADNNKSTEKKDPDEFADHVADTAVVCDGTAKALQYIEFDSRMLDDHMTQDYKDSIRSVLSSLNATTTTTTTAEQS
jgi:hypothetical protein